MRWDEDETMHDDEFVDRWMTRAGLVVAAVMLGLAAWIVLAIVAGDVAHGRAPARERPTTYVVTAGIPLLPSQPVTVQATSRLDAVTRLSLTVWTAEEWTAACREHDKAGQWCGKERAW